jgi:dTDP-4-amino-4,6-dideoxygalactose transaminase
MIQGRRRELWETYASRLSEWAAGNGVGLPAVPADREQAYHMFYLLMPSDAGRQRLIAHLKAQGILAVSHYVPLHGSPVGRRLGGGHAACPVTDAVASQLVRLPFFTQMTDAEQDEVIQHVQACEAS